MASYISLYTKDKNKTSYLNTFDFYRRLIDPWKKRQFPPTSSGVILPISAFTSTLVFFLLPTLATGRYPKHLVGLMVRIQGKRDPEFLV